MKGKEKKYTAYVVPETHWDRAWYLSFEHFRMRLVKLTEDLLNILDNKKNYKKFAFDGQTIVLEDVLEIRPEFEERIRKHVQDGRLSIGPWYVLPDVFIVSGESLIRNLLIGHQVAGKFGKAMQAGYIPDPFGHVSQMPQILAGFDIDSILFMRGVGEEGEDLESEFRWVAPDGETSVIACHLVGGYGNLCAWGRMAGVALENEQIDYDSAMEQLTNALEHLKNKRPTTNVLLLNNGVDHLPAQPSVPEMIQHANRRLDDCKLIQGDYEDFIKALKKAKPKLQKYQGELHNGKYFPLLSGVFSARMYLKQMNAKCEQLLCAYAEPLCTMLWQEAKEYPSGFMTYAWKELLKNHPHDDICGCSIDPVHTDMENRFTHSRQVSESLASESMNRLATIVNSTTGPEGSPIVVYNPTSWKRNEVVKISAIVDNELVSDGKVAVVDPKGKKMMAQTKVSQPREHTVWRKGEAIKSEVRDVELEFLAENLPQTGLKTFYVTAAKGSEKNPIVTTDKQEMENELIHVAINKNGTVTITDKKSGVKYPEGHIFEDTEDVGDEYDYSPLPKKQSQTVTSKKDAKVNSIKLLSQTPFSASFEVAMTFRVPKEITSNRTKRSGTKISIPVKSVISLKAGSPRVDFVTTIDNKAKDHRMRVLFPSGIETDTVQAGSNFDVVERPVDVPKTEGWCQPPVPTKHVNTFVSLDDGKTGLTLINKGLPEYEARRESKQVTLCQTLFRSVDWLSRDDLQTREGNAGPSLYTPEAQCFGENTYEYAVVPHRYNWERSKTYIEAYNFYHEIMARTTERHGGFLPTEFSTVELSPDSLVLSALKKAEDDDAVIVRFFNIGSKKVKGKVAFQKAVKKIALSNFNEEAKKALKVTKDNKVSLDVPAKRIICLKVWYKD